MMRRTERNTLLFEFVGGFLLLGGIDLVVWWLFDLEWVWPVTVLGLLGLAAVAFAIFAVQHWWKHRGERRSDGAGFPR